MRKTELFGRWLDSLRNLRARARVQARLERLAWREPGPGYRVYFTQRGRELVVLLAGGDKSTQAADIRTAVRLARNLAD